MAAFDPCLPLSDVGAMLRSGRLMFPDGGSTAPLDDLQPAIDCALSRPSFAVSRAAPWFVIIANEVVMGEVGRRSGPRKDQCGWSRVGEARARP